jgi:hypothetical protein
MIARAAAILEYLASGGVVEPPMMIVVAHPDDETIGIEQGVAGFLVRHKWEMAEAIRAAASIDSEGWRKIAQERFSLKRMIEGYFRYYRALARARSPAHEIYGSGHPGRCCRATRAGTGRFMASNATPFQSAEWLVRKLLPMGISLSDYLDALVDADHPGLTDAPLESLVKQPNWGEYHIQSSLQERLC